MTNHRRSTPFHNITARDVLRLAGKRRLIVIAPHPDDETLGCGSLIAQAVKRGIDVAVISLTDGDASHPASLLWPPKALGRLRAGEMRRALARLGAGGAPVRRLGWGDGHVGRDGGILRLRSLLVALRAGVVLVTSDADHHPDHQAAARLTRSAVRGLGVELILYAVWSRAGVERRSPDPHRSAKLRALAAYRSQVSGYIADDPDGFRLSAMTLRSLMLGAESFVRD